MTLTDLDMSRAACTQADDYAFHTPSNADIAKRICSGCPIVEGCREAALELEKGWGENVRASVFGGMTPAERFAEDRRRWPELQVRKKTDVEHRKAIAS